MGMFGLGEGGGGGGEGGLFALDMHLTAVQSDSLLICRFKGHLWHQSSQHHTRHQQVTNAAAAAHHRSTLHNSPQTCQCPIPDMPLPYTRQFGAAAAVVAADLWSNMDKHHGFGLSAQGVLQQLSQLAVAEGNVGLLVGQS